MYTFTGFKILYVEICWLLSYVQNLIIIEIIEANFRWFFNTLRAISA